MSESKPEQPEMFMLQELIFAATVNEAENKPLILIGDCHLGKKAILGLRNWLNDVIEYYGGEEKMK